MSFAGGSNVFSCDFNPASVLANLQRVQKEIDKLGVGGSADVKALSAAFDKFSTQVVSGTDKAEKSFDRHLQRLREISAAYGRTGVEKLNAQRQIELDLATKAGDRYGKLAERLKEINRLYDDMAKRAGGAGGAGAGGLEQSGIRALRGLRDIFEGRMAYGEVQIGRSLWGLSGGAFAAGGIAAAIAGITAAAIASAKSLATYGVEIHNVELRTGLTAKQVTAFGYAAKLSGQDVSIFERTMRGLTQAVEDQSSQGERARGWLTKFGVDIRGLREGTISTADAFLQISHGIGEISNPLERNKAELDLFKRAGIEAIPVIEGLEKAFKFATDQGWGPNDKDVERFLGYQQSWVTLSMNIEEATRNIKMFFAELLAGPAGFLQSTGGGASRPNTASSGSGYGLLGDLLRMNPSFIPLGTPTRPANLSSVGFDEPTESHKAQVISNLLRNQQERGVSAVLARYGGSEARLKAAESELSKMPGGDPYAPGYLGSPEQADAYMRKNAEVDAMKAASQGGKRLEEERRHAEEQIAKTKVDVASRLSTPNFQFPAARELRSFAESNAGRAYPDLVSQMQAILRPELIQQEQDVMRKAGISFFGNSPIQGAPLTGLAHEMTERTAKEAETEQRHQRDAEDRQFQEQLRGGIAGDKLQRQIRQFGYEDERLDLQREGGKAMQLSELGAAGGGRGSQRNAITAGMEKRIELSRQLEALEHKQVNEEWAESSKDEEAIYQMRLGHAAAIHTQERSMIEARVEGEVQIAELRKKEIDDVKKQIEGLLTGLITKPSQFGRQLATFAQHQLISGVTGPISGGLAQMLYGGGGGGGGGGTATGGGGGGLPEGALANL